MDIKNKFLHNKNHLVHLPHG